MTLEYISHWKHNFFFSWSHPILEYVRDSEGNIVGARGFLMDVFKVMQKRLNFTSKSIFGTEDAWGIQDGSGKWMGIVGKLARGEVDISTTGLEVLETRSRDPIQ